MKIIEAHAYPDHIHLYVEIPPKMSVSSFVEFLEAKGGYREDIARVMRTEKY